MKAQNIALYAAMATVIAGVLIFMSGNNIGSIVLGIGALVMFGIRGYNRAVCHDKAIMPSTDRKSTRLNSSHQIISYAVLCLNKKKKHKSRKPNKRNRTHTLRKD